jgi:hypothetical protein
MRISPPPGVFLLWYQSISSPSGINSFSCVWQMWAYRKACNTTYQILLTGR